MKPFLCALRWRRKVSIRSSGIELLLVRLQLLDEVVDLFDALLTLRVDEPLYRRLPSGLYEVGISRDTALENLPLFVGVHVRRQRGFDRHLFRRDSHGPRDLKVRVISKFIASRMLVST